MDWLSPEIGRLLLVGLLYTIALTAIVALTLNTSAYLAELFHAGVGTIPSQIVDAAPFRDLHAILLLMNPCNLHNP